MSNRAIRGLAVLGAFVIIGIFTVQIYWLQKAFHVENKQFEQSVSISLARISEAVLKSPHPTHAFRKIERHASNYYILRLDGKVDTSLLHKAIHNEFATLLLASKAEYGLYDTATQQLLYGNVVLKDQQSESKDLPILHKGEYYLALSFPSLPFRLNGEMYIWIFSTVVLLVFLFFYAYALFVILKQKRLSEVQRDFVNNLSHEFKTPLSTISLVTETLENAEETQTAHLPFLHLVKQEASKLNDQVDKILLSNTTKTSAWLLKKEQVDVHELIKEITEQLRASLKPSLSFQCDLAASHSVVLVDKGYTLHALNNLVDNAIKYSGENAQVKIKTENKDGKLCVSITDNGIGIASRYRKKIFEPFFRVPTGDLHNVRGFGIGLHFVKNIVKAHRWKLLFDSELHKGSRFILQIPV